jgi:uncharacterized glyoxalase superfamily metalloenzyme YdcJ
MATAAPTVDKVELQNRLFAELSRMFGSEVPLYDKSLLVNRACNRVVCALLGQLWVGFRVSAEELERTSGERHGAIRIGRPDEYRWVARFFAQFGMEPHNFYDMTRVGSKSQPIIATAFRSSLNPEHRVFTSLLMTDYFDAETRRRIEELLAQRVVFSPEAKALIEKGERQGGLDLDDATALIREGTERIFKWTGKARDHGLYKHLCDAGFKIAADIACFGAHHLNHLTPNTLCMDLYTAAMKHALGELDRAAFVRRAVSALTRLAATADEAYLRLSFRHLTPELIAQFGKGEAASAAVAGLAEGLAAELGTPAFDLSKAKHAGFKDFTEGPSADTPVLLRQDAYKALTEPVEFVNPDGKVVATTHTARFGEIEQRFYATTPAGRELYDRCLAEADAAREKDPGLPTRDFGAYEALYAAPFKPFPKSLAGLLEAGLVFGRYAPTAAGLAAKGRIGTADVRALVAAGHARVDGVRYEDFLPVSAAGIFASNLSQYGTKSTAAVRPEYTRGTLEEIMGRPIIDSTEVYAAVEAESILSTLAALGVLDALDAGERARLSGLAAAHPLVRKGAATGRGGAAAATRGVAALP